MRTTRFCYLIAGLCAVCLIAQAQDQKDPKLPNSLHTIAIRAALLIDGKSDTSIPDAVILIEGEKITAVGSRLSIPAGVTLIDLGDSTLLPGLIDAHTHLLLEMDGRNVSLQDVEMLKVVATESTAERALLGAKLGRENLEAGITTVRDVGNSGVN
jgi:imidazolonepropionase-like amidohydrolase